MIPSLLSFPFFTPLVTDIPPPERFTLLLNNRPHPLCLLAAQQLQHYIETQQEWKHNFGLTDTETGPVIGKMFGVLVVQTPQLEIGYISAFSGKLAGGNHHAKFVPPVFDSLVEDDFLQRGMQQLALMGATIKQLKDQKDNHSIAQTTRIKTARKKYSADLQQQLFDHYFFANQAGEQKNVSELFPKSAYKNPPSGAGECATPKLLQYAFTHQLKPLALAEFWWGQSPKSAFWKHKHYYPCCREKCEPILAHMLMGIDYEKV